MNELIEAATHHHHFYGFGIHQNQCKPQRMLESHWQHRGASMNTQSPYSIKTTHLIDINNVTSRTTGGYALPARPHGELALVGYQSIGTQSAPHAAFLCVLSMQSHIMARLEGDAFARAGDLLNQSTNPFQLCHPHLVVNGKASIKSIGASNHA